ncbi:MAG: HAD-IIIA family hydrolase [Desulfovibrionaceae bacterium]|nr:HAD-IIIA family hydrolase [Desulfovibrionaceae bacterium]
MPDRAVELAKNIKLLVLDVDGVLTDGGLYYDDHGLAMKRFHVLDGLGIKMAQAVGLEIGVITGLNQKPVEARINELGVSRYIAGTHDKITFFKEMCAQVGVSPSQTAFMGDDLLDFAPMKAAGLAMAVPNAVPEIIETADWVSTRQGGQGAVREAVDFILDARGLKAEATKKWVI